MIVLDTHAWVWWVDDHPRLRRDVRERIDAETDVCICAISLLEVATAVSLRRLVLRPTAERWLDVALHVAGIRVKQLTRSLCLESVGLPGGGSS